METRAENWTCSIDGCENPGRAKGLCRKHYFHQYRFGYPEKKRKGDRVTNPLYSMWHERKQSGVLCDEWLDFVTFCEGVGDRPSKGHFLVPIDGRRPYGPSNFRWLEKLKRAPGESQRAFWARKWAHRQANNPGLESRRNWRRHYGLTGEDYAAMLEAQGAVCAICREPEKSVDPKTMAPKRLAVDHCHTTKKVRGLLCFRCNSTIGKVNDSPEILTRMAEYLICHAA